MIKQNKRIWLTWEYQIRNRSLSNILDAELYEILEDDRSAIGRYLACAWRTISIISSEKPSMVFHQNPSIFLGLILLLLRPIFRFELVTDTHNAGLYPAEGKYKSLNWLGHLVARRTDLLIVHNELVAEHCEALGLNPSVLPDPLPELGNVLDEDVDPNKVVFVCRWSADEPYEQVISAYSLLKKEFPSVELYITGKPPRKITERKLKEGINLTGFLEENSYTELLKTSAVMVVLTDRTNSLNCGGYEALSLAKPCVLYSAEILRMFFGSSFYYTSLASKDIASAIGRALVEQSQATKKMKRAREEYLVSYRNRIEQLLTQF